jgi:small subunit ribosomal protein S6
MNEYEMIFIAQPSLSEEESETVASEMESIVKEQGAEVQIERWGKRKLAYEVKKCREGYYFLFTIHGEASTIEELERRLKLDDRVLRYLAVRTDLEKKRAARRAEVRSKGVVRTPPQLKAEEATEERAKE